MELAARCVVIQNSRSEDAGLLGSWLAAAGVSLACVHPYAGEPVPGDPESWSGIIVMGGPMDAWDDVASPWLPATRTLLARAVAARVPTLGVCLGAQLLALATGGEVRRGRAGPEFGVRRVRLLPAAATDPLLSGLAQEVPVVQWHSDEVARLPLAACRLAAADPYEQAFRVGTHAWGLQFHVETPVGMVRRWAAADEDALHAAGLDPSAVVGGVEALDLAETWEPVARRFAGVVLRRPMAGPGSRRR